MERLAAKYGMSRAAAEAAQARVTANAATEGLDFHLDRARSGNTFDAHRLIHYAHSVGKQDALKERLMAAYFVEGAAIGEPDVLARLAVEVGLDEGPSAPCSTATHTPTTFVMTSWRRASWASPASRSSCSIAPTVSPERSRRN